jgi:hypothetical protein
MSDIYINKELKYPLTEEEYNKVDKIWEFNKEFKFMTLTYHEYRSTLINNISKKYSQEEFYNYEKIIEKLYWNLHNKVNSQVNSQVNSKIKEEKENSYNYEEINKVYDKFYEEHNFRSYINKVINYDDIKNKIYYCKQEGSEPISKYNKVNHLLNDIMSNRLLYEKVMNDEINVEDLNLSKLYRQADYGFPNFNINIPFVGSDKWRQNKINHMYYDKGENNWFILLHPK